MHFRIFSEENERLMLSDRASLSANATRKEKEERCDIRTEFQRDRDRILHSKSFRRLKYKTQVFLSPEGDHYRTRLTHTLEVAQISRTIARALRLNEDLCEAIALGHDLGHTPFGHCGEHKLNQIHETGFKHNEQSLRVVDHLENRNDNRGLNLTNEVREGILTHSSGYQPKTLEAQIVQYCDKIAYLNHDIDDAIRAKVLTQMDLPKDIISILGHTHSERISRMILNTVRTSQDLETIRFTDEFGEAFKALRTFMFKSVYLNRNAKKEEGKAEDILEALYNYYKDHPEKLPKERLEDYYSIDGIEAVKDYVAGMTDRYAVSKYQELFIPKFWL